LQSFEFDTGQRLALKNRQAGMNKTLLILTALLLAANSRLPAQVIYTNQSISAKAEIFGAGNAGLPDGSGLAPAEFNLPTNAVILTMTRVTGAITLNGGGGTNDADGVITSGGYSGPTVSGTSGYTVANAYGGISGITIPGGGALVGVFEPAAAPAGAAPASLDFTSIGTGFTSFAPALYQTFYIGDGLTGDGTGKAQQFVVPSGATRLFLGISDAPLFDGNPGDYGNNSGAFTASFQVTSAGEPVADDFTNISYNAVWTLSELNTNCTAALTGSALDIEASPLGGGSDLFSGTDYKAVRLLQPVNPARDWIIETKFYFNPADDYSGAGLLLATTNGAFTGDTNFDRIAERAFYPNAGGSVIRAGGNYVAFTSATNYLRLQKTGTNYYGWFSADGTNWTSNGSSGDTNAYPYVGLFVIRYPWDAVMVNSSADFYYFHVTPLPLTLGVQSHGGSAVLSWPEMAAHFAVESATNLSGASWTTLTGGRAVIGSQIYATNAITATNTFYRLRYP
jgi:hypothetical protein